MRCNQQNMMSSVTHKQTTGGRFALLVATDQEHEVVDAVLQIPRERQIWHEQVVREILAKDVEQEELEWFAEKERKERQARSDRRMSNRAEGIQSARACVRICTLMMC